MEFIMDRDFTDSLQLPKDVIYRDSLISLTGERELYLENHKNLLSYTTEEIKVRLYHGSLCITGKKLTISYYTNEELKITGKISSIAFGN